MQLELIQQITRKAMAMRAGGEWVKCAPELRQDILNKYQSRMTPDLEDFIGSLFEDEMNAQVYSAVLLERPELIAKIKPFL